MFRANIGPVSFSGGLVQLAVFSSGLGLAVRLFFLFPYEHIFISRKDFLSLFSLLSSLFRLTLWKNSPTRRAPARSGDDVGENDPPRPSRRLHRRASCSKPHVPRFGSSPLLRRPFSRFS